MTFDEARKRYKNASGPDYTRPSKEHSTFERNAWLLRSQPDALLAIVQSDGDSVLHGSLLNAYFRQLCGGLPAPKISR
jgi:hypothetical protein